VILAICSLHNINESGNVFLLFSSHVSLRTRKFGSSIRFTVRANTVESLGSPLFSRWLSTYSVS